MVERTIRTIKSLTRANLEDGLTFEESVSMAFKTIKRKPHNTLKMTTFQLHYGRKPRTPITNLIGQPACLLSDWKKTLTIYVSAQPAELQVFTIHDSDGELADYLVFNESRKRGLSASDNFKNYQFFEKETKLNAMKCRFKSDKILTAAKETKHTIITTDGKTIHKKLASNPLKFQPSKIADETRKPTKRCTRCGRFSNEDLCDTHKRVKSEQQKQSTSTKTFPTMPAKQTEEIPDITIIFDSQSSQAEELPSTANIHPEITITADIKYGDGNIDEQADKPENSQIPAISPSVGCSTELAHRRTTKDADQTPTGSSQKDLTLVNKGVVEFNKDGGETTKNIEGEKGVRRSNRFKTAKSVEKMGGYRIFLITSELFQIQSQRTKRRSYISLAAHQPKKKLEPRTSAKLLTGSHNPKELGM